MVFNIFGTFLIPFVSFDLLYFFRIVFPIDVVSLFFLLYIFHVPILYVAVFAF